ncbi:MAG: UDP-glucose 4-epimerase GalE [Cytophagales bacterium]|nr:UDP-glucose 4-epimerase GalE [Cytophagales bacterium]
MSKILVTGGAGYIGSHTVVELINAGYTPVMIDNFANAEKGVLQGLKKITQHEPVLYEGDCADKALLREVFSKERITGVIHFAAYKAVGESVQQPLKYYRNNIDSLLSLLEVMPEFGIQNLVFSSSCTVYGQPDKLPVTETTPKKPAESPYGNTKQICEEIMQDTITSGVKLKMVALRYFNPIGAHPSAEIGELPLGVPQNLIPFVTQTAAGIRQQLTVFGDDYDTPDGSCVRDYIHVVDLAVAHVKTISFLEKQKEDKLFEVFNLGTGRGNTVLEVVKTFEKVSGQPLNYQIGPRRSGDVVQTYADVSKARDVLGWQTTRSLEDSLRDAWNWQKKISRIK